MLKNAKVRVKILVSFGIILVMMLVTTLCAYYNFNNMEKAENRVVNDVLPLEKVIDKINTELVIEESEVQTYIASNGDARFLETYSDNHQKIEDEIKNIEKFYSVHQNVGSIMENEINPNVAVLNKYFDSQIELVKNGKGEIARDRLGDGKVYMDVLNHVRNKLSVEIDQLSTEALKNSKQASGVAKWFMGLIFLISVLVSLAIALLLSRMIATPLKRIVASLQEVSNGNLTIEQVKIDATDEIGVLANAVNTMQSSVRNIIVTIVVETENVNKALEVSNANIVDLTANLEEFSAIVDQLSAGLEETAASTAEINATSLDIETAVDTIAGKAQEGALSASEISKKAIQLKDNSLALQTDANETRLSIKKLMDEALEKTKEVERIRALSQVILQISSQTNLLALNAAIESARVGEAGKGFAVVAEEIRTLAEDSKETVKEIEGTINTVFEAVKDLIDASKLTLEYIETKVVASYKESVTVGENYDKDAKYINGLVTDLSATSEELSASIKTVTEALNEISRASNEGAEGTNEVADKVSGIRDKADEVKTEISRIKQSADYLKDLVRKFKV